MTNEEKAIELIGCEGRKNCLECGGILSVKNGCSIFRKTMAMAQWKDKQFVAEKQELIDDVCFLLVANLVKTHLFSIDSIVEFVTRFRQSIEETK